MSLEEFLASPLADEEPSWEYLPGGRLVRKVSPSTQHGITRPHLGRLFLKYVEDAHVDLEVVSEVRAVLPLWSPVPDMAIYQGRIPVGPSGDLDKYPPAPPSLAIEILSPGQTQRQLVDKCQGIIRDGAQMGLVVDPKRRVVVLVREDETSIYRGSQELPLDLPELAGLHLTPQKIFARLP